MTRPWADYPDLIPGQSGESAQFDADLLEVGLRLSRCEEAVVAIGVAAEDEDDGAPPGAGGGNEARGGDGVGEAKFAFVRRGGGGEEMGQPVHPSRRRLVALVRDGAVGVHPREDRVGHDDPHPLGIPEAGIGPSPGRVCFASRAGRAEEPPIAGVRIEDEHDLAAAARYFQRAVTLAPHDLEIIRHVVVFLQSLGRLEDAIQKVDEAELQDMLRATVEGYTPGGPVPPISAKDEWQPISRTLH